MQFHTKFFVALLVAISSCAALAVEPSASAKLEVEQLLTRLGASGCEFQRNGSWHTAAEAQAHLGKKYQYLLNKQLMKTSEDFVSLAATKSSMSGEPYMVKCGKDQMPSAVWMAAQLKEMRVARPGIHAKPD